MELNPISLDIEFQVSVFKSLKVLSILVSQE
jgi:hypothetical protein